MASTNSKPKIALGARRTRDAVIGKVQISSCVNRLESHNNLAVFLGAKATSLRFLGQSEVFSMTYAHTTLLVTGPIAALMQVACQHLIARTWLWIGRSPNALTLTGGVVC